MVVLNQEGYQIRILEIRKVAEEEFTTEGAEDRRERGEEKES
jgi:hypothetical protein